MGVTERHWFEDEEPELTDQQLEDFVSMQDIAYKQGYQKGYSDGVKEWKAVKPRVSSVEQHCGNCNKVIEMDGWKACPWCGTPILWEAVGRSVK